MTPPPIELEARFKYMLAEREKATKQASEMASAMRIVQQLLVEIGLETFGRKPAELRQTDLEWKYKAAQRLARQANLEVKKSLVDYENIRRF